jgi:nucleoside-diphosphate-sugar epimerase
MTVLVTGGAGFIGSHLAEALLARGEDVIVFDNLGVGSQNVAPLKAAGASVVKGDICDAAAIHKTMRSVDSVFHLAAMNRAQRSIARPLEANAVNVDGTLNVLEAARKHDVERFVFASSSSVYGGGATKLSEDAKPKPLHPYGVGKLAGEEYCRVYNDLYSLKTVSLRYVSVYGPRQRADIEYAAVIPKFIGAMLARKPLTVYGTGAQTRQFTFVRDTVDATLAAWRAPASRASRAWGGVFNVATSEETSVNEIVRCLERLARAKAKVRREAMPASDPLRNAIDVRAAKRALGFSAKYSFERGLRETFEWFERNR